MRERAYLISRYRALLGYIGALMVVIGGLYMLPLLLLFFFPEERQYALPFVLTSVTMMVVGAAAWWHLVPDEAIGEINMQEGAVIVSVAWLVAVVSGLIPFVIIEPLNVTQALFESTSGWTGAGLTVVNVTQAPNIILLYRSLLQLAGGAGLAIIALAAISGPIGYGLSQMEGRTDKLAPHVQRSTSIVMSLYSSYVILGVLALYMAGMGWFDAINHAFTAVATGGFSTRPESIGYWNSPQIEAIIIVLMLLGSINFLTAYTLLQGKFKAVMQNGEIRVMVALILSSVLLLLTLSTLAAYPTFNLALRVAVFETVTTLTTGGFNIVDYRDLNDFAWLVMIILMLIGGGSGSTSGAIKQVRIYVLYKAIKWELRKAFLPERAVNEPRIWQGDKFSPLSDKRVRQVALFIGLYGAVFLLGSGVMVAYGYPLADSLFEFASTLGTVGVSIGITSSSTPTLVLWVQIVAMLMGRLEFFALLIGIIKMSRDIPMMMPQKPKPE